MKGLYLMAVSIIIYGVLLIVVVIIVVMLSIGGDGSVTKQNSFYSEEEALKVLGIRKESLKTMVSEEILRAYPHNNGISYRKEDIEELSRNHKSSQE